MSRSTEVSYSYRVRAWGARILSGALFLALAVPLGRPASADIPDKSQASLLDVTKSAYWTYSLGNAIPPTATRQFPPQVICLVATRFCEEDVERVTDPVNDLLQSNSPGERVPVTPVDGNRLFVPEGSLPTGVVFGARRYQSAVQFRLPEVSENEEVSKFLLLFTELDPTYHLDSEAFRQAVLAGLACAGRRDPAECQSELGKVKDRRQLETEDFNGIEACPILVEWEGGPNQPGTKAPDRADETRTADGRLLKPEIDCGFGANGVKVGASTWVFDLTAAANAWAAGDLPNRGVVIRPVVPENLAHGDPDLSTHEQITLGGPAPKDASAAARAQAPAFILETEPKTEPIAFRQLPALEEAAPAGAPVSPPVVASRVTGTPDVFGAPATSVPAPVAAPVTAPPAVRTAPALASQPVTEWWVWLVLPALLGFVYATTHAFTAEAATVVERSGAMTRLIEMRRGAGSRPR